MRRARKRRQPQVGALQAGGERGAAGSYRQRRATAGWLPARSVLAPGTDGTNRKWSLRTGRARQTDWPSVGEIARRLPARNAPEGRGDEFAARKPDGPKDVTEQVLGLYEAGSVAESLSLILYKA